MLRKASRILGRKDAGQDVRAGGTSVGLATCQQIAQLRRRCRYLPNLLQQLVVVLELQGDMGQQALIIRGEHHLRHNPPKKPGHKHPSSGWE